MTSFWQTLAQPIIGLSPMDGITDHPFRHIMKKYGQPAIMYTEFTSVEGVCHGADRLLTDFLFDETQRPIIGQIYGTTPEYFRQTAITLCQLGFDAIDINMGCPAKNVAHSGAGAALILAPKLAQEIITATKAGVTDWLNGQTVDDCPDLTDNIKQEVKRRQAQLPLHFQTPRPLPVSVKTRIGYNHPVIEEWIPTLLELEPAAITVHGRTLKQQYGGQANWDEIGKAAELARSTSTLVLGNGDVHSKAEALTKVETYGVKGVLIGRAAMGNPWVFEPQDTTTTLRFQVAVEHARLYEATFGQEERYNFLPMRKHLGWYAKDFPNATQIRIELFQAQNSQEVEQILVRHGLLDSPQAVV